MVATGTSSSSSSSSITDPRPTSGDFDSRNKFFDRSNNRAVSGFGYGSVRNCGDFPDDSNFLFHQQGFNQNNGTGYPATAAAPITAADVANALNVRSIAEEVTKLMAKAKFEHDQRKMAVTLDGKRREEERRMEERMREEEKKMEVWKQQVQAMSLEGWIKLEKYRKEKARDSNRNLYGKSNDNNGVAVPAVGYTDANSLSDLLTRLGGGLGQSLNKESINLSYVELSALGADKLQLIQDSMATRTNKDEVETASASKVGESKKELDANRAGFGGGDSKSTQGIVVENGGDEGSKGEGEKRAGHALDSGKRPALCDSNAFQSRYHEADSKCSDIMRKHDLEHQKCTNRNMDILEGRLSGPSSFGANGMEEAANSATGQLIHASLGGVVTNDENVGLGAGHGESGVQKMYNNGKSSRENVVPPPTHASTSQSIHHAGGAKSIVDHVDKDKAGDDFRKYMMAREVKALSKTKCKNESIAVGADMRGYEEKNEGKGCQ